MDVESYKTGIGLITIHDIYNYGSILQTYATRCAAAELSRPLQIIDYKYPNNLHNGPLLKPRSILSATLKVGNRLLKDMLPGRPHSVYMKRYAEARQAWYGETTRAYSSAEALRTDPPSFGTYVAGSDQIWHPRSVARDPTFFLDFAPAGSRRVSYASSFGLSSIPAALATEYRRRITTFDELGVRERSGVRLVSELTGREATLTLDPTLLFDGDFWRKQSIRPQEEAPYIVCYGASHGSRYMERLALHLSQQTGWKVVRLNGKFHDAFDKRMHYVLDAGPREWLGYLANAQLVIGQSFHATAFAVNFGRPMISLLRGESDHDERQRDFLDLVDLSKNSITIGDPFPAARDINIDLDTAKTERLLSEHRDRSFAYFRAALA